MQRFKKNIYQGLIHFRDRHQFELKSEFLHIPGVSTIDYSQEFYLFIPETLHINAATYSKEQFYRDQTNFIRFKTPVFTFFELISSERSPLNRLQLLCGAEHSREIKRAIQDEAKLLGNVLRSAIRERVRQLVDRLKMLEKGEDVQPLNHSIQELISEIREIQQRIHLLLGEFMEKWEDTVLRQHITYVNQFVEGVIEFHLTGLLKSLRKKNDQNFNEVDELLCEIITEQHPLNTEKGHIKKERFQYRKSLLNKFVLGALRLRIQRQLLVERYNSVIAMTAAAIAMLIFLVGSAMQGEVFLVHSTPFIIVTTLLYVLKDRIKDGIKAIYHEQATRWFPDYNTEIFSSSGNFQIGRLREVFAHLRFSQIPEEIEKVRNRDFHDVLEVFRRPEAVMYYKTEVHLNPLQTQEIRRYDLNTIFRLNIHRFLEKASDPYAPYTVLNTTSGELEELELPKVYHINIIVRNSFKGMDQQPREQLQKFRLVIDKEGIKRVEQIWREETEKQIVPKKK